MKKSNQSSINLKKIAELCGVSATTVSRVINNGVVSKATKIKVLKAIDEYNPSLLENYSGDVLINKKNVGIIYCAINDLYFSKIVTYLSQQITANGHNCIFFYANDYDNNNKIEAIKSVMFNNIDCLVLVGSTFCNSQIEPVIKKISMNIPTIILNGDIVGNNIYNIQLNETQAMYELALLQKNSNQYSIVYFYNGKTQSAKRKLEGFKRAFTDLSEEQLKDNIFHITHNLDIAQIFKDFTQRRKYISTIVTSNDYLAERIIDDLNKINIEVPNKVSVTGFYNSYISKNHNPTITTVENNTEELCNKTIEYIENILHNKPVPSFSQIDFSYIKRQSSKF